MVDSLVPKAELKNATRDLFSLSGESRPPIISFHGEALPASLEEDDDSIESSAPRSSQASMMFSLAELKKSVPERPPQDSLPDQQLWQMQAVTPLFGTADDAALLTAPLQPPQGSGGAVSLPHRQSHAAHKSLALWVGGGGLAVALVLGGIWNFAGSSGESSQLAVAEASQPGAGENKLLKAPARAAATAQAPAGEKLAKPPQSDSSSEPVAAENAPDGPTRIKAEPPVTLEISQQSAPKPKKTRAKKKSKRRKIRKKVAKKKVEKSTGFNKSKAKRALVSAASKASGCGKKGRAGGKGKIRLTFGTNGRVKSARIVSARFTGSSTGKCALRHFRAAKIPAFSGKPVTVAKSFTVH